MEESDKREKLKKKNKLLIKTLFFINKLRKHKKKLILKNKNIIAKPLNIKNNVQNSLEFLYYNKFKYDPLTFFFDRHKIDIETFLFSK